MAVNSVREALVSGPNTQLASWAYHHRLVVERKMMKKKKNFSGVGEMKIKGGWWSSQLVLLNCLNNHVSSTPGQSWSRLHGIGPCNVVLSPLQATQRATSLWIPQLPSCQSHTKVIFLPWTVGSPCDVSWIELRWKIRLPRRSTLSCLEEDGRVVELASVSNVQGWIN